MRRKSNRVKRLKKQSKDKMNAFINSLDCHQLENFSRVMDFASLIVNDQDWDFDFLDRLILRKLELMKQYFETHHVVEDAPKIAKTIDLAINLKKIYNGSDDVFNLCNQDYPFYVNPNKKLIKKTKEFKMMSDEGLDKFIESFKDPKAMSKWIVRQAKANRLFWLVMAHYEETWWD